MYGDSRKTDMWWIVCIFSTSKVRTNEEVSLLGKQFYSLLSGAIMEDIYILSSAVKEISFTSFNLLSVIFHNLVFSVTSVCLIIISVYYLLIKNSDRNVNRQNGREYKVTKSEKNSDCRYCNSNQQKTLYHVNRRFIGYVSVLMFFGFLLSLPWEFIRLYQTVVAEKVTHTTWGIPAECVPEKTSVIQSVKSWLRWQFSWSTDPCLQYQKALLVDPIWQVSPLRVLSSAFSHCIVYPIETILGGLGRALRAFFSEIPTQWQPFLFVITVVFILLTLVMWFGYRIHLPFILRFEPKTPVNERSVPRRSTRLCKESNPRSVEPPKETDVSFT